MRVKTSMGTFDTKVIRKIGFGSDANVKLFLRSANQSCALPTEVLLMYMHAESGLPMRLLTVEEIDKHIKSVLKGRGVRYTND